MTDHPPPSASPPPPAAVVRSLAPEGVLRVAANMANRILFQQGATGAVEGAGVRIAAAIAARLAVPLQPVEYPSAGKVTEALATDGWDLGFLAIDPGRSASVRFTRPYLYIEATYLVRPEGPTTMAAVDAAGTRIATARGAAYALHLARELRHARLVQAATPAEAFALFAAGEADAMAGVRQALARFARRGSGRVLAGSFQTVHHALALPARAAAGLPWLDTFLDELRRTGFVRRAMLETGQGDATLAP